MYVARNSVQRKRVLHHQVFGGKLNINSCRIFDVFIGYDKSLKNFFLVTRHFSQLKDFVAFSLLRNVCQPQVFFSAGKPLSLLETARAVLSKGPASGRKKTQVGLA